MIYCGNCGTENLDEFKFCSNCGSKLEHNKKTERENKQSSQDVNISNKPENNNSNNASSQQNPMIGVSFYESMPGRLSLGQQNNYMRGILEIDENEMIIHKKSYWRGKDRGKKHIRYDKITSVDFDSGKFMSLPAVQVYLTSVEYSFRSNDNRLESFYNIIREKIDIAHAKLEHQGSSYSPLDELKKLAELKEMGVVTEEEFELKKNELLNLNK